MTRRRRITKRQRKKIITWLVTVALAGLLLVAPPLLGYLGIDVNELISLVWQPSIADYQPSEGTAEVHFIDVGQASSILVIGSDGVALIDAGESSTADKVIDYLRAHAVDKIDYLFATHPHSDHMGGCRAVMRAIPTDNFVTTKLDPTTIPTTNYYSKLITYLGENKDTIRSSTAVVGDSYSLGGGLTLQVLGPVNQYTDINDTSLVIRMDFGETSFLFTGDMETSSQQDMAAAGVLDRVSVLSSPHHGSSSSIDRSFMHMVSPQSAVISCGIDNDYGHPHKETIELYEGMGIDIYRTDLMGSIKMTTDGSIVTATNERSE